MFWSLVVLLAACLVFAAIGGFVTIGKPDPGPVTEFDAHSALVEDAQHMPFPVREPALPDGWQSNSGRLESVDGHDVSVVGWVTPSNTYVELVQTDAPMDSLRGFSKGPRPSAAPITVGGREWTIYSGDDDIRDIWVTDLGDVRIGLTGGAERGDFETMATAVENAAPLAKS